VIEKRTFTGSYTIKADCTGSLVLQIVSPVFSGQAKADAAIDDEGSELRAIQTAPPGGAVITIFARKV